MFKFLKEIGSDISDLMKTSPKEFWIENSFYLSMPEKKWRGFCDLAVLRRHEGDLDASSRWNRKLGEIQEMRSSLKQAGWIAPSEEPDHAFIYPDYAEKAREYQELQEQAWQGSLPQASRSERTCEPLAAVASAAPVKAEATRSVPPSPPPPVNTLDDLEKRIAAARSRLGKKP